MRAITNTSEQKRVVVTFTIENNVARGHGLMAKRQTIPRRQLVGVKIHVKKTFMTVVNRMQQCVSSSRRREDWRENRLVVVNRENVSVEGHTVVSTDGPIKYYNREYMPKQNPLKNAIISIFEIRSKRHFTKIKRICFS